MNSLLIILAAGLAQIKAVSVWLFIVLYALVSLESLLVIAGSTWPFGAPACFKRNAARYQANLTSQ